MNTVIEPCCYSKQLTANLEETERGGGVSHFFSFSDWDTDELIPWTLGSVPGCDAVLCLVQLDVRTLSVLSQMMRRTYISDRANGTTSYVVNHFTLITQPSRQDAQAQRDEISSQLGVFIEEGRVTVCEDLVGFRCLAASNGKRSLVIQGSLNQTHMEPCTQMYTMTTTKQAYSQAMEMLASKKRIKSIF